MKYGPIYILRMRTFEGEAIKREKKPATEVGIRNTHKYELEKWL